MSASTFVKVRYEDGSRRRTVVLRSPSTIPGASGPMLVGTEVGPDGAEVFGRGFDSRTRIIDRSLIVWERPMVFSLKYAELEEV